MISALGNIVRTFPLLFKLRSAKKKQLLNIDHNQSRIPDWCTAEHKRRMNDYALRSTWIMGEGFAILRGQRLTNAERNRYTMLGFAAPHLDDLSDQEDINTQQLKALVTIPDQFFTFHQAELLCSDLLKTCYQDLSKPQDTRQIINRLFEAQLESRNQSDTFIKEPELRHITKIKGGLSVQLFHSLLDHEKTQLEVEMSMQLGFVIQLLDDLFDAFNDLGECVYTLANTKDMNDFFAIFQTEWQLLKEMTHRTAYPKSNSRKALTWWYFFISTAFMYIGQMKRSGIKNIHAQHGSLYHAESFNWEWPDLLDAMERGLKEKF